MQINKEPKWNPSKEQIENMILPAYSEIAKISVSYIKKFDCPPEYVADMLRDIADAIVSSHPESEGECSCC
tara:strand:- start:202 stop:414 length:213 start_codon:yes stop_codon:yes gene_type:complete